MNPAPVRIGVDDRGSFFYVARVRSEAGRPQIEALARFERSLVRSHPMLEGGALVFAVADDLVTKSELMIAGRGRFEPEALTWFEIAQSLLDDESEFSFDALPLETDGDRFLGMTVRRSRLSELVRPFTASLGSGLADARFALRAEALGRGYLSFARSGPGEFIGLVDFTDRRLSLCFLYRKKILGVAHLNTQPFDLTSPSDFERLTIELKTIVNFKLAALSQQNISVPLSAMVLSGRRLEDQALCKLKKYFPVPIDEVSISSGFFPKPDRLVEIPAGEYLVALGLTTLEGERFC